MSDVPHFEPDETETAYHEERAKQRRERRRFARWEDRYWLVNFLWREGLPTVYPNPMPVERKYWHWHKRAYFNSIRSWQDAHLWEKRLASRKSRQRERIELRRQRR